MLGSTIPRPKRGTQVEDLEESLEDEEVDEEGAETR